MNICFYTTCEVSPTQGGTERITNTVATSLTKKYGCKCYSLYSVKARTGSASKIFVDSAMIRNVKKSSSLLSELFQKWKIDILINQGDFSCSLVFSKALHSVGAKYVFCHHFEPGWDINFVNLKAFVSMFKEHPSIKTFIKLCLFPYFAIRHRYTLPRNYALSCREADQVVLLSSHFIPQFLEYGHISESGKIGVIHNSLSFQNFYDVDKLKEKEKMVLIVSRMDETQKRISHALKIWNEIEKKDEFKDWTLRIVGIGEDLQRYKHYVKRQNLRQVVFEGQHPSEGFYQRASIFMMTSKSEGWGLTLTESQQNGCVPLAFDTYGSLHEIITDGYDGFIIPEGDMYAYLYRMEELMSNENLRTTMATNAIKSSHRFEQDVIAKQWYELLKGMLTTI